MNGKQRVQAAIARRPVDRVPLGLYAVDHDTVARVIGRPTYVRNKIETAIALWDGRRDELAQGLKADTVDFYRRIDCADLLLPKEAMLLPPRDYDPHPPRKTGEDRWEDRKGRVYQAVRSANEIQCVYDPAPKPEFSVADFEGSAEVDPPDDSVFEVFDHVVRELGNDHYIAGYTGGLTAMTLPGGMETGLMVYGLQPEVITAANRQLLEQQNARDPYFVREGAAGALIEQDMAGTNGPLISPRMFRELCLPFMKERVAQIKARWPQVILHNCGNNLPLMGMFVECGIDCYQSLQTTAGMEIGLLKERYGNHLCFWGGVPVENLIAGTPEDVRRDVRTALERGAPGGGFILGPSHSIAMNTRYENFMAMLDEYVKLRDKF